MAYKHGGVLVDCQFYEKDFLIIRKSWGEEAKGREHKGLEKVLKE